MHAYEGPTCVPFRNMSGESKGVPHNPAIYGRYIVIDLDANNWYSRQAWAERHPGMTLPSFGFGVCRHGFGLQDFGGGVVLSEEEAETIAHHMNIGNVGEEAA